MAVESAIDLSVFWAKASRKGEPEAYHPLWCHLIDVGLVAGAMWERVLSPAARRALATGLGFADEEVAGRWVAFLAASHDLGKLSPGFQGRLPTARPRLAAAGFPIPPIPSSAPHGTISAAELKDLLGTDFGVTAPVAASLADAVGGHHGIFPALADVQRVRTSSARGAGRWVDARRALLQSVATTLELPRSAVPASLGHATALSAAGLVSVADWIGSNATYFPYAATGTAVPTLNRAGYVALARDQATRALGGLGWLGWPAVEPARRFEELFPGIAVPTPVQQAVVALAESIGEPGLMVVEAPTGEGKTEAALYLAERYSAALGQRGIYVALPTQATSNQMFTRVRDFLAQSYPHDVVDLQLLHGHADLSAAFAVLRRSADRVFELREVYGDAGTDGAPANVVAAEWFTHRKRGLLAPFGVGTVDQALLAALQTRHVFVRLFGLAHKTVIIDEVHAYDTYMSTLLERLLSWLGALGTSVVLLSATLPADRRRGLVAAYARGRGKPAPTDEDEAPYPRVTRWSAEGIQSRGFGVSTRSTKTVRLAWCDARVPAEPSVPFGLGERLDGALAGGGCAVVICNTVKRAQAMYRSLTQYFPGPADDGEPVLDLLHARYPFEERDRREKRALIRFGKEGAHVPVDDGASRPVRRPDRAVLVATQIIEQSLDLDFDLMVTDLAPTDLVLQRIGRLHRHERLRPRCLAEPTVWLGYPDPDDDGLPRFGPDNPAVYDEHVLLRSWLALRDRTTIAVPAAVEDLIDATYDRRAAPVDAGPAVRQRWETTRDRSVREGAEDRARAEDRWLPAPDSGGTLASFTALPGEEDAPEMQQAYQALTRLSEPSVPIVCLYAPRDGSSGHPSVDPEGKVMVDLAAEPEPGLARQLLARSVTVSTWRLVRALWEQPTPRGWVHSPLLRHHRPVCFDAQGNGKVGTVRLHLDERTVGLEILDDRPREKAEKG